MRITELVESTDPKDNFIEIMRKFLPLAMKIIGLKDLPDFKLVKKVPDDQQPTFGKFVNHERRIYLSIEDRHPIDVLRTLAHELTHYKQGADQRLGPDSGRTGSPEENEAHQVAGIVMRHFDKQYPEYFKDRPIMLEDWNKVNRRDKTDGLSQKAVNAYRRENPGSKLKTAVTTKPSKLKKGSKAAKRRKSFCARMGGNKGPMKKPNGKPTPKALALRRWNCESIEQMAQMIAEGEQMIAGMKQGLDESKKKGLYYYVNKRKKAGTSRDASSPKAPTAQAWITGGPITEKDKNKSAD
jgi:hypothetical protein